MKVIVIAHSHSDSDSDCHSDSDSDCHSDSDCQSHSHRACQYIVIAQNMAARLISSVKLVANTSKSKLCWLLEKRNVKRNLHYLHFILVFVVILSIYVRP